MQKTKLLRTIVLILAIVLIGIGIYTGDFENMFKKATMICYECIGIG